MSYMKQNSVKLTKKYKEWDLPSNIYSVYRHSKKTWWNGGACSLTCSQIKGASIGWKGEQATNKLIDKQTTGLAVLTGISEPKGRHKGFNVMLLNQ